MDKVARVGVANQAEKIVEVGLFFRVLGDQIRPIVAQLLTFRDLRAGEIAEHLQIPQNAVYYHLKQLRVIGLLRDRRSNADGRDIYYSIDQERLGALYRQAGMALQLDLRDRWATEESTPTAGQPLGVLFLCTHNSARSQFAEGMARSVGGAAVAAYSACHPLAELHHITSALLPDGDVDPSKQTSKMLDTFAGQSFDYVITVCDRVREHHLTFPGEPQHLHWSIPDPTAAPEAERWEAFRAVRHEINVRVRHLLRATPQPNQQRRKCRMSGRPQAPLSSAPWMRETVLEAIRWAYVSGSMASGVSVDWRYAPPGAVTTSPSSRSTIAKVTPIPPPTY